MVGALTKGEVFYLLQNPHRRAILRYLVEHPERESFRRATVAEEVAAWEYDTTAGDVTPDQRQRISIPLAQTHLPVLDDLDVIDYDHRRGLIRPTPLVDVVSPFLEDGLHGTDRYLYREGDQPETA